MQRQKQITISGIPEISAIYFALLQCGYDYCFLGREKEHADCCRKFAGTAAVPDFFSATKQSTCEVYPYWPRAAILETATFYLSADHLRFRGYDDFRQRIVSATNIESNEKDADLWTWLNDFPAALSEVLGNEAFHAYLEWEKNWICGQNVEHADELRMLQKCLDVCASQYDSPVRDIRVVVNPIKCIYSADYHLTGESFVFSSGIYRADSVIHEFLHHVVRPLIVSLSDAVLKNKRFFPELDDSYYMAGDDKGYLNAFEEHAVRELTGRIWANDHPASLVDFLKRLT